MDTPLLTKEFEPEKVVVGSVTEKNVMLYYPLSSGNEEYRKLTIQTPKMKIIFDPEEKKTKDGRVFVKNINFTLSELGSDSNKKNISLFKEKIERTDSTIQKSLPEVLKLKTFNTSIWKNSNYSPTMKISMPYKDGVCKTVVFDSNNERISDDEIKKGVFVSAILKLDNMWIWNDKIGVNWVVEQFKIFENKQNKNIMMIREVDD